MTESSTKTFEYRQANQNDETYIYAILEEVAAEIQVSLYTQEAQSRMITEIVQCRRSGKSWIAIDESGRIVGIALARPDFHEPGAVCLSYIGVSKNSRRNGVCSNLMEKLKANGAPITASVLNNNRSGMAKRLVENGFTKVKSDDTISMESSECQVSKLQPKPNPSGQPKGARNRTRSAHFAAGKQS